jgi:zinc/manganese transport system permease protein
MDQLFEFAFMRNAYMAGTLAAVLAGVVGYFVVLRGETFAGHTLSVAGFPGAAGAVLLGLPQLLGLAVLCSLSALGIASAGRSPGGERHAESAAIGTIQAFTLALGLLFVSLYRGLLGGVTGILFGSVLGITLSQVVILALIVVAGLTVLGVAGRPLLQLSIDPQAAAASGIRVHLLSITFLVLMGLSVAAVALVTGALLVFALLVIPAAAAQQLVTRPALSIVVAVALGLAVVWLALVLSYFTNYPIGFLVTSLGFAVYLLARGARRLRAA